LLLYRTAILLLYCTAILLLYCTAMADWARPGNDASTGDFAAAAKWITRGGTAVDKAAVELDEVAPAGRLTGSACRPRPL
jgi:hypothetical protein